jgi:hypothetical protein
LIFYNNNFLAGTVESGNYIIDLSVTSAAVNGLNGSNLNNNIGANDVVIFDGALPAISGNELVIPLSTPYTYNSASGNLLMDVNASGLSGGTVYLDADNNGDAGGVFSREYTVCGGTCGFDDNWGLVTGFTTSAATSTAVPEPSSLSLFGATLLGFAGFAFYRRRKQTGAD